MRVLVFFVEGVVDYGKVTGITIDNNVLKLFDHSKIVKEVDVRNSLRIEVTDNVYSKIKT
jgi:hypothetical protein